MPLMTTFDEPPQDLDALESEALARVRHLGSGKATRRDIEQTRQWGRRSAAHAQALMQAGLLWDRLGPAGRNLLKRRGDPVLPGWEPAPRVSRRALVGGALACSGVAWLAVSPPLELWPSLRDVMVDYRTATGEQRQLTLPGGTALTLNTATSINVRRGSGGVGDRVEIVTGEAAVTVDAAADGVVVAGDGEVSARTAQFNMLYRRGVTRVTCLDGEVRVSCRAAEQRLRAGQQVDYGPGGLGAPAAVDPAEVSAWREGVLIFHYRPLDEVVAEINRYRPGRVMVVNAALGRRLVNGRFRIDNLDAIMSMFQQIFAAKLTRLPGGIVVLS